MLLLLSGDVQSGGFSSPAGFYARTVLEPLLAQGERVVHTFDTTPIVFARMGRAAIARAQADPLVEAVVPNCRMNATRALSAVQSVGYDSATVNGVGWALYGLDRLDQEHAVWHDASSRIDDGRYVYEDEGEGVRIYVIDTGVRTSHAEFAGRVAPGYSVRELGRTGAWSGDGSAEGWNTRVDDTCYHGTHVAGTAAGATYGVAKKATIVPVQVLACRHSAFFTTAMLLEGIDWAAQDALRSGQRAVLSMSVYCTYCEAVIRGLIREVVTEKDIVIVAAAGNEGHDACRYEPAGSADAITVGATDYYDEFVHAATYGWGSNTGRCVDVLAPGAGIVSAGIYSDVDTRVASGTSMSAPLVSGIAAQLLARHPGMSALEVKEAIKCLATPDAARGTPADTTSAIAYNRFDAKPDCLPSRLGRRLRAQPQPQPTRHGRQQRRLELAALAAASWVASAAFAAWPRRGSLL